MAKFHDIKLNQVASTVYKSNFKQLIKLKTAVVVA